jgi:hypothetical protein
MQTEDYARAIIRGIDRKIDPAILDQRVEARLRRQQLLTEDPATRYRAVLDEAVLHREVGGKAVMRGQLARILDLAGEERATVQVIPFRVGAHASTDSNFDFLEFGKDSSLSDLVFVEGLVSHLYHERPNEIARYREALDLRDAALSSRDSLALVAEIAQKIRGDPCP